MSHQKKLVVILGPTGVGKTALAVRLAQHYHTEIISADSRQFFRELKIGVARPDETELAAVKHHFIAFLPVTEEYSAGRFESDAIPVIQQLMQQNDVVICAGGSMLYVDALINGLDDLPSDSELKRELEEMNIEDLLRELAEKDPEYFQKVDQKNPHRIIRAVEVCRLTGKKFSSLRTADRAKRDFEVIKIGLNGEREWVYDRINRRVDLMIEAGLENEVKTVMVYRHLNALNTVGYKEFFDFFDGIWSREEAIQKIKQYSRNFAKRQLTWWRRDESIQWIDVQKVDTLSTAISIIDR
ncbi:MAG: tRNA (adenosine(37)-N6)-dimethylallyltransferase MiaA [Flavobacteriales bacterium]|nr:tRNA (adenosine(37)-N6)-dimethylallyltransferase MiaA [Flavobacteriales bacterium]